MDARARLERKVRRILSQHSLQEEADAALMDALDMNEILTMGLLPMHSKLRTTIAGAYLRDKDRKRVLAEQKRRAKEEEMVEVEVPGGGKCKITVWMTRAQAERELASR